MLNEVIEAFLDPLETIFIQVSVAKANESSIDAARKYVDAGRVGRGRAPRGPESKHSEMRCKAIAGRSGSAPYQRRQINIFHCRSNRVNETLRRKFTCVAAYFFVRQDSRTSVAHPLARPSGRLRRGSLRKSFAFLRCIFARPVLLIVCRFLYDLAPFS